MSGYFNIGKNLASGVGQAINKVKTKINKTKLDQTVFEIKNKMPITFKSKKGKSESNTESYKRTQKDNTKVIKGMLDKAAGKK